tara:strand:- start:2671 stop:2820 length:150 start_codon:yes stop_codon:yes gene_type:complete
MVGQHMEIFHTGNGKEFGKFLNLAQYMLVKKYACIYVYAGDENIFDSLF